jgi:hypothetical protein
LSPEPVPEMTVPASTCKAEPARDSASVGSRIERFFDWHGPPKQVRQSFPSPAWLAFTLKRLAVWNLDMAIRYRPAAALLGRVPRAAVLEVGGGAYGVTGFIRRRVFGCDLSFAGPKLGLLSGCRASAAALPFPDGAFDIVLSMDMLEHLERSALPKVLGEMCRVSRRLVMVGVPCGQAACEADARLDARWRARHGRSHRWLAEHVRGGLPEPGEIRQALAEAAGRRWGEECLFSETGNAGVRLWSTYMGMLLSPSRTAAGLLNKLIMPVWRLLPLLDSAPYYRTIFVAEARPGNRSPGL